VIAYAALVRKELTVLFGSPMAYVTLTMVGLITALVYFDHLRIYNQILFLYSTTTMGGFESDTIPPYVNLRDQVFLPVMEQLAIMLIGLVPLATMRVFAEERAHGTDELLLSTQLSPNQIVLGKFSSTLLFVGLMLAVSFVYPATSLLRAQLGLQHLISVYLGLFGLGIALASIGLVCSAFAKSQLVAAISAYATAFVFYDFTWTSDFVSERVVAFLDGLSLHARFGSFAEGLVSLADVAYFAGVALVALALLRLSLDVTRVR
jgi:ABC-2 type transport system permease protein